LPRLRRLQITPALNITGAHAASLSTALAGCTALDDLTLCLHFTCDRNEEEEEEEEAIRTAAMEGQWTSILQSVPNLRRLVAVAHFAAPFLSTLPAHLPQLEELTLYAQSTSADCIVAQLAHPTLQQLEVDSDCDLTSEQVHSLLHNPRLPQLRSCNLTFD
jgi:hypothetical protein